MLKVGQKAPDFTLPAVPGDTFSLSAALGHGPVVLVFYPGDFTPVCTKQLCEYSTGWTELESLNATVVGISSDTLETHVRFREEKNLKMTLAADPTGKVARLFDAWYPIVNKCKRSNVVLDADGVVVRIDTEFLPVTYKSLQGLVKSLQK